MEFKTLKIIYNLKKIIYISKVVEKYYKHNFIYANIYFNKNKTISSKYYIFISTIEK